LSEVATLSYLVIYVKDGFSLDSFWRLLARLQCDAGPFRGYFVPKLALYLQEFNLSLLASRTAKANS
jgi:hypothetical protein